VLLLTDSGVAFGVECRFRALSDGPPRDVSHPSRIGAGPARWPARKRQAGPALIILVRYRISRRCFRAPQAALVQILMLSTRMLPSGGFGSRTIRSAARTRGSAPLDKQQLLGSTRLAELRQQRVDHHDGWFLA